MEREKQKIYIERSTFRPRWKIRDLVMVFSPTIKTARTKKFKQFCSGPQSIREIINDHNFVIEDVKTKKSKISTTIDSKVLTVEVLKLLKKRGTRQTMNQ